MLALGARVAAFMAAKHPFFLLLALGLGCCR